MVNSHKTIPKVVLKYFICDGRFYYYDFNDKRIHKSHSRSYNAEKGYYSDKTEKNLDIMETDIGQLIKYIQSNEIDIDRNNKKIELIIKEYVYSLITRNEELHNELLSDYNIDDDLERKLRGHIATYGIVESMKVDFLREYKINIY